jgi:hypothetical protein
MRGPHCQLLAIQHLDDLRRENGLHLLHVRVRVSEIAKHVPTSMH